MDYPKSVPGVGLVNNQFVDEDPVTGTPGSLIPASWGNAVTQELLAVIQAASLVPSEANNAQLLQAIKSLTLGGVQTLSASAQLPATARGLVLVAATDTAVTVTLPSTETVGVLELTLRRTDAAANAAVIAASGTDKIMLDTTAAAAGQASTELLFAGDYLHLRSDGAGKWWCVGQAQLPGSLDSGLVAYISAGVHTFVVPPILRSGRRQAIVTVVGAGGAGANGASGNRGAGGGSGGTAIRRINLAGIATVTATVGSPGQVGSTVGGTSSFGAYCSATGGTGGQPYAGGTSAGGAPGMGSGGDMNMLGGYGSDAAVQNGVGNGGSGDGAPSYLGGAARSGGGLGVGTGAPGSGGGGSETATTAGASGAIIIQW